MFDENTYLVGLFRRLGLELGFDLDADVPFIEWADLRATYGTLVPSDEKTMVLSMDILVKTYDEITNELLLAAATQRPAAVGALRLAKNAANKFDLILYTDQVLCLEPKSDELILRGVLMGIELSLDALSLP